MNKTPNPATFATPAELEAALREAAIAHGQHEQELGHEDANWPAWYAEHMWNVAPRPGRDAAKPRSHDHGDGEPA